MGTRGAYGFRINNKDKVAYNHFDSYPSCLGVKTLEFVRDAFNEELKELAENIVFAGVRPTEEQKEACRKAGIIDLNVSTKSEDDWYCLLRGAQGDFTKLKEVLLIDDASKFLLDSLFCEWAYIINIDTKKVEIYKGFNKNPNADGRYAGFDTENSDYYGVELVQEISFDEIRKLASIEDYCKMLEERSDVRNG